MSVIEERLVMVTQVNQLDLEICTSASNLIDPSLMLIAEVTFPQSPDNDAYSWNW
ncbi:hypothetical protein D3C86_2053960 [compost metagenome]